MNEVSANIGEPSYLGLLGHCPVPGRRHVRRVRFPRVCAGSLGDVQEGEGRLDEAAHLQKFRHRRSSRSERWRWSCCNGFKLRCSWLAIRFSVATIWLFVPLGNLRWESLLSQCISSFFIFFPAMQYFYKAGHRQVMDFNVIISLY